MPGPKRKEELKRTNEKDKSEKKRKRCTLEPKSQNPEEPGSKRKRSKEVRMKLENKKKRTKERKFIYTIIIS